MTGAERPRSGSSGTGTWSCDEEILGRAEALLPALLGVEVPDRADTPGRRALTRRKRGPRDGLPGTSRGEVSVRTDTPRTQRVNAATVDPRNRPPVECRAGNGPALPRPA